MKSSITTWLGEAINDDVETWEELDPHSFDGRLRFTRGGVTYQVLVVKEGE